MHLVTEELDAGPIMLQATVPVLPDDTGESLAARILVEEHRLYPAAIALMLGWRLAPRRAAVRPVRISRRLPLSQASGLWRDAAVMLQRQHRDLGRAIDPDRHVYGSHAAADEECAFPSRSETREHRKLPAGNRAHPGQHDLPSMRMARQHELDVERRSLGEPPRIVREEERRAARALEHAEHAAGRRVQKRSPARSTGSPLMDRLGALVPRTVNPLRHQRGRHVTVVVVIAQDCEGAAGGVHSGASSSATGPDEARGHRR